MPHKIMVIDDEENMCQILKQLLESEGYVVETSTNSPAALDIVLSDHFNLVISDVSMPVLSGIDLLKSIKSAKPNLPVIFMTGQDMDEVMTRALQNGLDGFIEKPFNIQTVFDIVREKLNSPSAN